VSHRGIVGEDSQRLTRCRWVELPSVGAARWGLGPKNPSYNGPAAVRSVTTDRRRSDFLVAMLETCQFVA